MQCPRQLHGFGLPSRTITTLGFPAQISDRNDFLYTKLNILVCKLMSAGSRRNLVHSISHFDRWHHLKGGSREKYEKRSAKKWNSHRPTASWSASIAAFTFWSTVILFTHCVCMIFRWFCFYSLCPCGQPWTWPGAPQIHYRNTYKKRELGTT